MTWVLLPAKKETVEDLAFQVTARGQGDRVKDHNGRKSVLLGDVLVVDLPEGLRNETDD